MSVKRNLARIGVALVGLAMLSIGVLSLIDFWPRWVWISLGVLGLVGIIVQFIWERHGYDKGGALPASTTVNQQQRSGRDSTNAQAGRDINFGGHGSGDEG